MATGLSNIVFESLQDFNTRTFAIVGFLVAVVYSIYTWSTSTDIPEIKGIFEIPGALPITGHLIELGDDHATVAEGWWKKHKQSVFQIKLGNTRAVVVNSFEDAKKMLVGHQSAVIDSSTKGFTIGSSPWSESCKNKRKAAGQALGRPAMRGYLPMFDLESYSLLRDTYRDSKGGTEEINIRPYIQRLALNTTLTLCYGIRMDNVYDDMLREILEVGSAISLLRSASENFQGNCAPFVQSPRPLTFKQDYIPLLRYLPNNEKTTRSKSLRSRRDAYLDFLLDKVRSQIASGTDKPCISAAILKDEETRLTGVEVSSVCLSLVSGGFETIPGTLTSCIGSLSTPAGQAFQDAAYADICRHYPDNTAETAWTSCIAEETIPYVSAIVREAARYYTVSSMSLPRKTVSPIPWGPDGAVIPARTMILINAQAANHDSGHFGASAATFDPSRWLDPSASVPTELESSGVPHFGFGAGARACSGQLIASRILYSALVRLIVSFRIVASESDPPETDYVEYNAFKSALVAIPRDFKVKLIPRDRGVLEKCLEEAEKRTSEFYKE